VSKGLSPSYIYMRGKGGQQYICGPMPLQATYNNTCGELHSKRTRVNLQGEVIHNQGSKCKGAS
jgi:hypothetical protein